MKALILEGRLAKRRSKKVRTHYFALKPGEIWTTTFEGQRILIIADEHNTATLYAGRKDIVP